MEYFFEGSGFNTSHKLTNQLKTIVCLNIISNQLQMDKIQSCAQMLHYFHNFG